MYVRGVLEKLGAQVSEESARVQMITATAVKPFDLIVLRTDQARKTTAGTISDFDEKGSVKLRLVFHGVGVAPTLTPTEIRSYVRADSTRVLPRPVEAWRLREVIYLLGLAERPVSATHDSLEVLGALASEVRLHLGRRDARTRFGDVEGAGERHAASAVRTSITISKTAGRGLIVTEKHARETRYSVRAQPAYAAAHWMLDVADLPSAYAPALV